MTGLEHENLRTPLAKELALLEDICGERGTTPGVRDTLQLKEIPAANEPRPVEPELFEGSQESQRHHRDFVQKNDASKSAM